MRNVLSRVLDERTLGKWGPLALVIGRRTANLMFFRFRDDWRQAVVEVALEAAASGLDPNGGKETVRLLGCLWRKKMREYGFSLKYDIEGISIGGWHAPERTGLVAERVAVGDRVVSGERKNRPRCGVVLCGRSGIYRNERYGWFCIRHQALVHQRRKRGWVDPYENIETAGKIIESDTYIPADSKNKKFWASLRFGMTGEEWTQMWNWACGYRRTVDPAILEKVRSVIVNQSQNPKKEVSHELAA